MAVPPSDDKPEFDDPSEVREEFDRLTDEERAALDKRLRHYAWRHFRWVPGLDLEELIQNAKGDACTGARRRRKGETLFRFLIGIMNSVVNHGWVRESVEMPEEDTSGECVGAAKPRRIPRRRPVKDVDQLMLESPYSLQPEDVHRQVECREIFDKACELVAHDTTLIDILELLKKDPQTKPMEVAEELGKSTQEIYNALKRLDRVLNDLRKEWLNVQS
jgi:hypothetical protein